MKLQDLSGNKIRNLRSRLFKDISNLRELRLNDNTIKHLGSLTFDSLTRLYLLHLENNGLEYIADNAVVTLELLRGLFLVSNNLTTITSCMFNGLRALTVLNVSFNQLVSIAEDAFASSLGLIELHLQHNNLNDINEDTFSLHTMLTTLDVSNNKISRMISFDFHRLNDLNTLGNRIDSNCDQLSLAMSLNTVRQFSSCIHSSDDMTSYLTPTAKFLHMPSFVSGVGSQWSDWGVLPAYSNDSEMRACDIGVRVRTQKCGSCREPHPPWCKKYSLTSRKMCQFSRYQDPSQSVRPLSSSFHPNQSDRLSGCPSRRVRTRSSKTKSIIVDIKDIQRSSLFSYHFLFALFCVFF